MTRYAKKDIYAEVEEEGGKINRLVAAAGQPIPAAYAEYVDDADTTTDVDTAHDAVPGRTTSARRARAGLSQETEVSHEEFRETAAAGAAAEAGAPDAGTSSAGKGGRSKKTPAPKGDDSA
ncbi:MAG: hypothetical protein M3340_02190 [Actinomycetota bacterium]|nr:hypothetical protein [Actinomycetota bacterium]